ncbi:MAG: AAA family ATPase [Candidatus Micrarchaeaceae archaeon]
MAGTGDSNEATVKGSIAQDVIRKYHRTPMLFYRIKDTYVDVVTNPNFLDSLLVIAALVAFSAAFPFYPLALLVILAIVLLVFTLRHAFLGFVLLMLMIFPMLAFQAPALAYVFVIVMTMGLVFGYRHYRTLIFASILVPLALSPLGFIFSIPALIIGVLIVGYKRAAFLAVVFVIGIVMLSAVTGVQNTAYISYNAQIAHTKVSNGAPALDYSVPNKPAPTLYTMGNAFGAVISNLENQNLTLYMYSEFYAMFDALTIEPLRYVADLIVLAIIVMLIDTSAVASRSNYKGTQASLIGVLYPLLYIGLSVLFSNPHSYIIPFSSFIISPAFLYILELYKVDIVKALDVRKEDLRLKFGEAFEDLLATSPTEKFGDIGDYEATKKELKEAIVSPIEEKAVSRAYNIKAVKGVLLFGPPGTGKTMIMRAIANDIRAGFYVIRASNLVSGVPGDTERRMSKIFDVARKNAPCILFIDEIDAMARTRAEGGIDEVHRQILSELLIELDGFQKLKNVVVVGATNVPNLIDPAVLRPGRFDKIIYMPLPDFNGRKEIFKIYLKRLPASKDIDFDELAKMTERFSGADIKSMCDNVAQEIAQEATNRHRVLEITQKDMKSFILATKPSTTLTQLKEYDRFKIDFERRTLKQVRVENAKKTSIDEVIGLEDAKKAIVDAIKIPLEHQDLAKKYKVQAVKGILMFGPPGNGKTMLMRAVSNELSEATMLQLSGSEVSEEGIDKALTTIKDMFNRAVENAPSILFIDELDGIAPSRKDASEYGVQLTTEFLQEMDGVKETPGVVLVCATNRPEELDPAILRPGRFDKLIFVQPPKAEDRRKLFELYIKDVPNKDIDFKKLADETDGYTGADIANICREAKSHALEESISSGKDTEVTMGSIEGLIKRIKPSAPPDLVRSYQKFLDRYGQR